jgi:mono/diheme cytochrome c family protein
MPSIGSSRVRATWIVAGLIAGLPLVMASDPSRAQSATDELVAPAPTFASQGWTEADRQAFYTTSQGSHMMPYAWFKALRRLDADTPFGADQLQRYGYLRNDDSGNAAGLPVGFVIDGSAATGWLGMTCSACHTGQIEYAKDGTTHALRLDGAPTHADFQLFLTDLTEASRATLKQPDRFDTFAKSVLGAGYTEAKAVDLQKDYGDWVQQFGDFMDRSLPATAPWGPGRLDAFGMIFNRVAAKDLDFTANFASANAPVSYPFLWNASRQDKTQWNGIAPNGLFIHALARNTGEVFGVFADFKPRKTLVPRIIDYDANSADFAGLQTLEELIAKLTPPAWPRADFPVDDALAAKGAALFKTTCAECHAEKASTHLRKGWNTPVQAVGTDPKMFLNAANRTGDPHIYTGVLIPGPDLQRFKNPAKITDILAGSVIGAILDNAFSPTLDPNRALNNGVWRAIRRDLADLLPNENSADLKATNLALLGRLKASVKERLQDLYKTPGTASAGAAYEARVLQGIWATAPYLHNGSVPSLWELLKPAKERTPTFMVGSRLFDPKNVGYATDHSPFKNGTFTTDPGNANGNGNQGHEYGTTLNEEQRWAIVEYLKTL